MFSCHTSIANGSHAESACVDGGAACVVVRAAEDQSEGSAVLGNAPAGNTFSNVAGESHGAIRRTAGEADDQVVVRVIPDEISVAPVPVFERMRLALPAVTSKVSEPTPGARVAAWPPLLRQRSAEPTMIAVLRLTFVRGKTGHVAGHPPHSELSRCPLSKSFQRHGRGDSLFHVSGCAAVTEMKTPVATARMRLELLH